MSSLKGFLFDNKYKDVTIKVYLYSAYYRMCILLVKPERLKNRWGTPGEESAEDESIENYKYAANVGNRVERVCKKTKWESKCLVRALTARKILLEKGIHSTLYLGCGTENGKMVAHAWLRVGKMYVTGGDGSGYATVGKFYS